MLLLIGWLGVTQGVIAWLANPLLVVGWVLLGSRQQRAATLCAAAATLCAASFLLCKTILTDEGGNHSRIVGYGLGYWLWLASTVVLFAGALVEFIGSQHLRAADRV